MNQNDNALTNELLNAVKNIKIAILRSQYQVVKTANRDLLSLYFGIGKYVSEHTRTNSWGTNAIESISNQLKKEIPGLRGFSATAIKRMRIFYEEWSTLLNRPLTVDDLDNISQNINTQTLTIRTLAVNDLSMHDFVSISFSHHYEILAKTKKLEERIFYIKKSVENSWNKDRLIAALNSDLYNHQGQIPNNFTQVMPNRINALKAIEMFKDNYLLDFVNVEELGARDECDIDERILEQQIVHNIKKFIMTFGSDFTFVGNQYHLEKFGIEQFPDLLFFNRELSALVCVELKFGEFKPAYLGQLSAYLRILDSEVKKTHENPSIGIILCKSANKSFVEFLIQGYDNPMGVATYKTSDEIKQLLPSEEDLQKLLTNVDLEE